MQKILVIEDDETIRMGLKYYLEQEEFVVIESDNGTVSLEVLKENLDTNIN